jgi:hypothetical protein
MMQQEQMTTERLLHALGLARRSQTGARGLKALGLLGLGLVAGGALALLFAPSSGAELRDQLARRLRRDGSDDDLDLEVDGEALDELIT